jgi:outer membrane scaffolding protein for murein synthesis (MipA/OmpV family)
MIRPLRWLAPLLTIFALGAGTAAAEGPQYLLNLGGGGVVKPTYPGADTYMLLPYPIIEVGRFYIPGIGQTEKKVKGIFFYPSFNVIGERKASDDNSLKGTKVVDWAFEAGLGAGFRYDWLRGFATIRQGFNGYSGQTGELGLDLVVPFSDRFEIAFGPRTSWATSGYMETYFGVTPAEAARSPVLTAYKPDAGFKTAGISGQVNYWIDDRTRIQLRGSWDRLIGDAGNSPIVKAGSRDQWTVGLGLSRKLEFNVFR